MELHFARSRLSFLAFGFLYSFELPQRRFDRFSTGSRTRRRGLGQRNEFVSVDRHLPRPFKKLHLQSS